MTFIRHAATICCLAPPQRSMELLRRVIIGFGILGFLIAVLLWGVWGYLNGHTAMNPSNAPFLSTATDWLWPSNLMLMAWHESGGFHDSIGLLFSALANGVIYSLVGLIVGGIVRMISVRRMTQVTGK